jgi:proteasome assembly chaperone (PAC2) family protein
LPELNLSEQPNFDDSVVIAAWAGWPDAAESATRAVKELARQLSAVKFGSIEAEGYYVFTEHRPHVKNGTGGKRYLEWPANEIYYFRPPDGERGMVLIIGVEPDLRWKSYTGSLASVAKANNAKLLVTVGALLDSVPHTRPPRVMGTTTFESLPPEFPDLKYPKPNYEGPSGITSATIEAFSDLDIPSVSIWGHAPHYLQVTYNPTITMAILKELQRFIPVKLDFAALEEQSREFDANLAKALDGQRELAAYVLTLEERFDSEEEARGSPEPRELMAELEAFLRRERVDGDDGEQEGPLS